MKIYTSLLLWIGAVQALPNPFRPLQPQDDLPSLTVEDWSKIHQLSLGSDGVVDTAYRWNPLNRDAISRIKGVLSSAFGSIDSAIEATLEASKEIYDESFFGGDNAEKTIWQLLNEDSEKYSKIVKLIELAGDEAKRVLDDREASITFFAPENSGIPDPHKPHQGDEVYHSIDRALQDLATEPSVNGLYYIHTVHGSSLMADDDDDDEKKRERKKLFQFILRSVLKYHGLPRALSATDLASNSTVETALTSNFGANDGEPLRVRIEKKLVPPSLALNFYAKVVPTASDIKARNGYLHTIDHPLIPPPSILDTLFLFPDRFSTLTSAVQKVHVTNAIGYEMNYEKSKKHHKPTFEGTPATTLFAPTNEAFAKLPRRLVMFLFSPFGERVLAKLLAFHVLPKHVVFAEHIHEVHGGKHGGHHHHHRHASEHEQIAELGNDPSFHVEVELPTLVDGENLKLVIDKSKVVPVPGAVKTTIKVNDVDVSTIDIPAYNGAFHEIDDVLKPPHKHEGEDGQLVESDWEDWQSWLIDWAESA